MTLMKVNPDNGHSKVSDSSSPPSQVSGLVIFSIFILAFGIRLYHIDAPPLDFEPERQYHSLILARNYFLQSSSSAPGWRKELWKQTAAEEYVREPPVLERVVAMVYRIIGKEQFWISRLLSVIFWLTSGWVLFRLMRSLIGTEGAVFSSIFYLFNPFGISASRSFMPDPLMILFSLLAISSFVSNHSNPSRSSFVISAILTGVAGLIKPFCLIPLLTTFISLSVETHGKQFRSIITRAGLFLFLVSAIVLPYYVAGLLPEKGFLRGYAASNFLPRLWLTPYFWGGWFDLIRMTAGYIPFIMGLFGILLAEKGSLRSLLLGMWTGYLCFGLLFSYSTHSQDYYHIILTPVVAMSLAPIGFVLFKSMRSPGNPRFFGWLFAGIMIFAGAASIHEARSRWKAVQNSIKTEVSSAIEIGQVLNHSTDVVSLASYYAKPLKYHAEIGGKRWPYGYDFRGNEIMGRENKPANVRLQEILKTYSPKFFVISDLEEFNRQEELKKLLYDSFPVHKATKTYVIFSLQP